MPLAKQRMMFFGLQHYFETFYFLIKIKCSYCMRGGNSKTCRHHARRDNTDTENIY